MFLVNDPGPWQDYTRKYPGKSIEAIKQQYLAEQLMYFQSMEQIVNQANAQGASRTPIVTIPPPPPPPALRLTFGLGFPVVDSTNVSLWNTLLGSSFTACSVDGLTVSLFSGGGFYLLPYCLADTGLVSIIDELNCVYGGGTDCFSSNAPLTTVILPEAIAFSGSGTFVSAGFLVPNITFYLPSCTNLGDTVLNNNVFNGVTGKTITLTVFASLMTCNSGNPDGDIQYLQANNTVTVVTV